MVEASIFPLEVRGVHVTLGTHHALKDVNLRVDALARTVVLGANGAGKSVLLRVLHGLIAPDAGTITWAGSTRRPAQQAMVFQRAVLLRRPALANIDYALAVNRVGRAERRQRAREAIERVGLGHVAQRQARVLSGGERQRLALARAWALRPRVLFLDEPTASLDPAASAEIERLVHEIHAAGTAIVMTTHHLGFARRQAETVVFLHEGRVTECTPADRFFGAPASAEAHAYLQEELP
ncbi:MAG: ATP-binding cassette domain-containing protein [Burkholderiales bacterium]